MGFEESWGRVQARLADGVPTTVLLDEYYLPMFEEFYQQAHTPHAFSVVAFDSGQETIQFLNIRRSVEVCEVPLATFREAWSEGHSWYDLVMPDALPTLTAEAARQDLLAGAAQMLPAHPGEYWHTGVPAIRQFANDMSALDRHLEGRDLDAALEEGFHQFVNIREQRGLAATTVTMLAEQLSDEALHEAGRALDGIAKRWNDARKAFVRSMGTDPGSVLPELGERIHDIADAEERGVRDLRTALEPGRWSADKRIELRLAVPAAA
jgi:hypothetical protein